jgi:hypothetical protein
MKILYIILFALVLTSCLREEKVDIGSSDSFIRYFNGGFNDEAVSIAKTTDGGYLILANTTLNDGRYKIKLTKEIHYGLNPILILFRQDKLIQTFLVAEHMGC